MNKKKLLNSEVIELKSKQCKDNSVFLDSLDLFNFQQQSFDDFTQIHVPTQKRKKQGLERLFSNFIENIELSNSNIQMEYLRYKILIEEPDLQQCYKNKTTYEGKIQIYLKVKYTNPNTKKVKEYTLKFALFSLPLMTKRANFVINGNDRVFVFRLVFTNGIVITVKPNKTIVCVFKPHFGTKISFILNPENILKVRLSNNSISH